VEPVCRCLSFSRLCMFKWRLRKKPGSRVSAALYSLRKNSGFDFVLKGRGFSRAVNAARSMAALQFAKKLDLALAFGWRGGSPLR